MADSREAQAATPTLENLGVTIRAYFKSSASWWQWPPELAQKLFNDIVYGATDA